MKKILLLLMSFGLLVILGISGIFWVKIVFFNHTNPFNPSMVQPLIKTPTPIEPTPAMKLTANLKNLPGSVKTYQINLPPFEIFGTGGQMAMAKALGFSANTQTYLNGNLTFYLEENKTLVINPSLGTIIFNNQQQLSNETMKQSTAINQDNAKQKVLDFFQSIKLSSIFWGWEDAKITAFDKKNEPTALASQALYYRLEPTLLIGEIPLTPPYPILADVGTNGELRYLSFWYPNLESEDSKIIKVPNQRELQKMIYDRNIIILGPSNEWPKTIDNLKLIYELPKFLDFAESLFLEPTLIFTNGKVTVKFKL